MKQLATDRSGRKSAGGSRQARAQQEAARASTRSLRLVGLMLLGLVVVVALIADLRALPRRAARGRPDVATDLQQLALGLDGPRYTDPSGLFSIVPPAGWKILRPPDCGPYNVVFHNQRGADVNIMATRVEYNDLPSLLRDIEKTERECGIATKPEAFFFQGQPAVRRETRLATVKVLAVDFVRDRVAHHLLFSVPVEQYDRYRPVLMEVLNTYRTGPLAEPVELGQE